jgi:hypothetical protein
MPGQLKKIIITLNFVTCLLLDNYHSNYLIILYFNRAVSPRKFFFYKNVCQLKSIRKTHARTINVKKYQEAIL